MMTLKRGWSKPSTILFATELPANERAFAFALSEAMESRADLILFHVCPAEAASAAGNFATRSADYAAARAVKEELEPLMRRAHDLGIACRVVVRAGGVADAILHFADEHKVDRVVMGVHTPGPVGKLLVGSAAETVLRKAHVPATIVGPFLAEGAYRNLAARTILCAVGQHPSNSTVARLAAEMAFRHSARLILQQIIPPQEAAEVLAGRSLGQMEAGLMDLIPSRLRGKVAVLTRVMEGDPTDELLYQSRVLPANLIVMGAQGASHFAAVTRAATVYKVLAYAYCPVMTLSPVLLAGCTPLLPRVQQQAQVRYIAGVV
jgi:nucleotide-binding universal stress UspA family protein